MKQGGRCWCNLLDGKPPSQFPVELPVAGFFGILGRNKLIQRVRGHESIDRGSSADSFHISSIKTHLVILLRSRVRICIPQRLPSKFTAWTVPCCFRLVCLHNIDPKNRVLEGKFRLTWPVWAPWTGDSFLDESQRTS